MRAGGKLSELWPSTRWQGACFHRQARQCHYRYHRLCPVQGSMDSMQALQSHDMPGSDQQMCVLNVIDAGSSNCIPSDGPGVPVNSLC